MKEIGIILIIVLICIIIYVNIEKIQKILLPQQEEIVKKEPEITHEPQPQQDPETHDLIQHNKNVLTQLDTYINKTTEPNYTQDNIALGTATLYDVKDIY
jgi:hypothetical protein